MSIFIDTTGQSVLGIGICARCSRTFPLLELEPDHNSPGLMVCKEDNDEFDPYRLPARQPDNIVLPFVRPDVPLEVPTVSCPQSILATEDPQGLQTDRQFGWNPQPAVEVNDLSAEAICDRDRFGVYGGKVLTMPFLVTVIDPGVEVLLSWPLNPGFEVLSFEIYAYYDVQNPTAQSLQLITTVGSGTSSYTDLHGYSINAGYAIIAIGENGERSYTPGQQLTLESSPAPPGPPALDTRMLFIGQLLVSTTPPDFLLSALTSLPITNGWGSAYRDIMLWLNEKLFWAVGYASEPFLYYSDADGSNQGAISASYLGVSAYPASVRPQLGGGPSGMKWVAGDLDDGINSNAYFAPVPGTADYSADLVPIPGIPSAYSLGLDAWSWDGGLTVLLLVGFDDLPNYKHTVIRFDVGGGTYTPLITSTGSPNGLGGKFARNADGTIYVAATLEGILASLDSGATWGEVPSPWPGLVTEPRIDCGVVDGVEYFVAILADFPSIYYSQDGVIWNVFDPGLNANWLNVVIGNGMAVFTGRDAITDASVIAVMQTIGTASIANAGFSAAPAVSAAIQQVN